MYRNRRFAGIGLLLLFACAQTPSPPPPAQGRFVRTWWSPSRREGNPATSNRVNTRVLPVQFRDRPEAKATNQVTIRVDEEIALLDGAELYLELWGGHPGTARKRFSLNGQGSYEIPEVGTAAGNCTFSYPSIPLDLAHLKRGDNVFEFSCEQGTSFWGHFLFEVAAVKVFLKGDHPDLRASGLDSFHVDVSAQRQVGSAERLLLSVEGPPRDLSRIDTVDYEARYRGFDENGDGETTDWHGFTKQKLPVAILGTSGTPPFEGAWDLAMVPDQEGMAVRARVSLKQGNGLVYETAPAGGLSTAPRDRVEVTLHGTRDLPHPFWSRASRLQRCTIELPEDPGDIERAELHVVIWDGGRGSTERPFMLNGHELAVTGEGRHDVLYRVVGIDPSWLRRGPNLIEVLSDTEHHGIEVLLPGPALVVRSRIRKTIEK